MHWIFNHIWLFSSMAIIGTGGFFLAMTQLRKRKRKVHPIPKSRTLVNNYLTDSKRPLLIRLPKLG